MLRQEELFKKADEYKNLIDKNRPFASEQLKEVEQNFKVALIYSSNSMEGNTLTLSETEAFLRDGTLTSDKPIKDYHEAAGHAEAYDYMLSVAKNEQLEITEEMIKKLHYLIYIKLNQKEAGQYRDIDITGAEYRVPKAEELAHFMGHFMNQMQSSKGLMHPIEYAAICHKRLMDIRPFKDGNGQIARLIMNLILLHAGYGLAIIPPELGDQYSNALSLAQNTGNPKIDDLIEFIAERVIETERNCCRLLKIN